MQALLLAAGRGTRLKKLSSSWPKCLMPINHIPLLEYWIFDLVQLGVNKIYINVSYLADEVIFFLKNNKYKKKIFIFREDKLLGTAGTIKALSNKLLDDTTIIVHSDNFCICNFNDFIDTHKKRQNSIEITMMTFETDNPKNCGIVVTDNKNIVREFYEKSDYNHGNLANAAIYVVEPSVIQWISEKKNIFDFSADVIPNFMKKIVTWKNSDKLVDIGTPNRLYACQNYIHKLTNSEQTQQWIEYFSSKEILKQVKKIT